MRGIGCEGGGGGCEGGVEGLILKFTKFWLLECCRGVFITLLELSLIIYI